jgi:hypothetical protein
MHICHVSEQLAAVSQDITFSVGDCPPDQCRQIAAGTRKNLTGPVVHDISILVDFLAD